MTTELTYEPLCGESVQKAVAAMILMADKHGDSVSAMFNGDNLVVRPGDKEDAVVEAWCKARGFKPSRLARFGAVTAADAVERWDAGDSVWTVELGGLGPGYEQALQIAVFELMKLVLMHPTLRKKTRDFTGDDAGWQKWCDTMSYELIALSKQFKLGLSGAQAGAAKECVYRFVVGGYEKELLKAGDDRRIQVSRSFPSLGKPKVKFKPCKVKA